MIDPVMGYRWGREADRPDADVVFLAGNTWRTMEAIEPLEADLRKPVISGNQATIWAALKVLRIGDVKGYGSLFRH
jgi:maleate cis-trans isomerase